MGTYHLWKPPNQPLPVSDTAAKAAFCCLMWCMLVHSRPGFKANHENNEYSVGCLFHPQSLIYLNLQVRCCMLLSPCLLTVPSKNLRISDKHPDDLPTKKKDFEARLTHFVNNLCAASPTHALAALWLQPATGGLALSQGDSRARD